MQREKAFQKLSFTSPVDAFLTEDSGAAVLMHLEPATAVRPKFLRCPGGPSFGDLDFNDGPADAPGPDRKEWQKYLGDYQLIVWGKPAEAIKIQLTHGYLYLDDRKLIVEHEPGLFFSADGEALDFRGQQPTWFSIPLQRGKPPAG